jgi:two-component system, NarL family, nitrate/nitrite sensor histidine kinase NarX
MPVVFHLLPLFFGGVAAVAFYFGVGVLGLQARVISGIDFWIYAISGIVLGALVFILTHRYLLLECDRNRLLKEVAAAKKESTDVHKNLAAVFRLSQKFVEASEEREIVEEMMNLAVDLVGAMGASFVPLDERGQPLTAVNYGDFPAPVINSWVEYLASPQIRQSCGTCLNHGAMSSPCPLLPSPFSEAVKLYCLPLRIGGREYGVLNLYLRGETLIEEKIQSFLKAMMDETTLALEGVRLRQRELDTLRQLQSVKKKTDLTSLLNTFLENIRDILKADFALLLADQGEENQPVVNLISGEHPPNALPALSSLAGRVLDTREAVIITKDEEIGFASLGLNSVLAAALIPQDGSTLGVILAGYTRAQNINKRHLTLMQTVTDQVALMVQNAYLLAELEFNAMMSERTRLAREIHDGLAQTLGFLKLQAAQMQIYLAQHEYDRLLESLKTSHKILADAYLEARQAIDGLRIAPNTEGLAAWIAQTAAEFQENSGLETELVEMNCVDQLASEVQAQLIRIVQEALSNVRKHAKASKIWISCREDGGDLVLEIRDDGIGFSPEDIPGTSRYGLQSMRERSDLIGAEFQVISRPLDGTIVRVRLPLTIGEITG